MWYRCYRCPDRQSPLPGSFREFEADTPLCPRCGAGDAVRLVPVHWLVADPKGPILGGGGRRYRLACDARRDHLATEAPGETFSATGDARAVTCLSCRGVEGWGAAVAPFREYAHLLVDPRAGGCCD